VRTLFKGTPYLPAPVASIELLGSEAPLRWEQTPTSLVVDLPQNKPNDVAWVFRIRTHAAGHEAQKAQP
jgi:alpha-L-fucosidase